MVSLHFPRAWFLRQEANQTFSKALKLEAVELIQTEICGDYSEVREVRGDAVRLAVSASRVSLQAQPVLALASRWSNLISSCIIERKNSWLNMTTMFFFLGVVLYCLPLLGLPKEYFKAPSDQAQAGGLSPLAPVNRLHKFHPASSKSAMLFVLLSSRPFSGAAGCRAAYLSVETPIHTRLCHVHSVCFVCFYTCVSVSLWASMVRFCLFTTVCMCILDSQRLKTIRPLYVGLKFLGPTTLNLFLSLCLCVFVFGI